MLTVTTAKHREASEMSKPRRSSKTFAVCHVHAEDSLYEMAGNENVAIRRVTGQGDASKGDVTYTCHCGTSADFYLLAWAE